MKLLSTDDMREIYQSKKITTQEEIKETLAYSKIWDREFHRRSRSNSGIYYLKI